MRNMRADKDENVPNNECREPDIFSSKFDLRTGCFGSVKTEGNRAENGLKTRAKTSKV